MGEQLKSDMMAFKAANPKCLLEDFIRWYSPNDWIVDDHAQMNNDEDMNENEVSQEIVFFDSDSNEIDDDDAEEYSDDILSSDSSAENVIKIKKTKSKKKSKSRKDAISKNEEIKKE